MTGTYIHIFAYSSSQRGVDNTQPYLIADNPRTGNIKPRRNEPTMAPSENHETRKGKTANGRTAPLIVPARSLSGPPRGTTLPITRLGYRVWTTTANRAESRRTVVKKKKKTGSPNSNDNPLHPRGAATNMATTKARSTSHWDHRQPTPGFPGQGLHPYPPHPSRDPQPQLSGCRNPGDDIWHGIGPSTCLLPRPFSGVIFGGWRPV